MPVKVGQRVQLWLGITTVKVVVIGFGMDDQVILAQAYEGVNHQTGRIEIIEEVYYRDRNFVDSLNRGRND